jgi:flavin-binding protein dodecin
MAKRAKKVAKAGASGDKVYKLTELVGTSKVSFADATQRAVERAAQTVRNLDWFEVTELRGAVKGGRVTQFQVKLKIGFRID